MAGKYTPLEQYLHSLPAGQQEATMSFEQMERILNDKLPPSAYQYEAWWLDRSKGSHVQSSAWLDTGWQVDTLNLPEKWVRFVRIK